ncbi:sensor domain-containing protein [Saccharospirillum salsuginis]|uniref:PAS domain S-box-containing protein/diguanylate cyclase (GGDEF) domain-containing protein n=1 Tax=Saccharospirillum salsuginis TaxID=418750 RepID=A0A918K6E1_9GAMM|nr:bifunctional diguanylate cyclase/phosphodiesterase [Saccharospirillum salsuginis]GGX48003.1 hypothetical protein GCM10007392_13600 [Saccharospirillum salsuginis]
MSKPENVTIGTAKLLLDNSYRLLHLGDSGDVLSDHDLETGADLRRQWRGFDRWLERYHRDPGDRNNFSDCVPGTLASLTRLGRQQQLLHVWRQLDVLKSSLALVRFNALIFDRDRRLVFSNQAAEDFRKNLAFDSWRPLLPDEFDERFDAWLAGPQVAELEKEARGQYLRWEISNDPSHHYLVMVCHPMLDRENYRRILEYSVDGIYQTSRDGELIYANHSLAQLFGYDSPMEMKNEVSEVSRDIYSYAEDRRRFVDQLRRDQEVVGFECEMRRKDGTPVWVRQNARSVNDGDGQMEHIIGTVADVTAFKHSEMARLKAEKDYQRLFESAQAGLFQSTGQGRFLRVNRMLAGLLGFDTPEACVDFYQDLGRDLYVDGQLRERLLSRLQLQKKIAHARVQFKRRNGDHIWGLLNAQIVRSPDSDREIIEGSILDITEQVAAENEIRYLAEHDALTGLPNRSRFQTHLEDIYQHWIGHHFHDFIVIFLDLDHFKDINDTLGHLVGDALLNDIAQRLQQPLNAVYQTFRLGGDEFAIVIDGDLSDTDLNTFCIQVCQRVSREFVHQDNHLKVTASLGVVRSTQLDLDNPETMLEDIMRAADLALYSCKRSGRAGYRLYEEAMRVRLQSEKALEKQLAEALERDELTLYFQPVFDTRQTRIIGAEALIRWPTETGMISPGQFIPLAERCGLIADVDAWVIRRVTDSCERLAEHYPHLKLSFNLSAHHFNYDTFDQLLAPVQDRVRLWGANMAVELTERVMFENTDKVISSLNELRRHGVTISLDDFGTGYSSLSYLTQFPVDKIKIDQSFIRDMLNNTTAMAVVQAAAEIGRTLKLAINAEGIETAEQLAFVQGLNINEVQGFYLGRPMPMEDFMALLESDSD